MSTTYVLDAPVFIYGVHVSGIMYTVPEVTRELKSSQATVVTARVSKRGTENRRAVEKSGRRCHGKG